jgi:hypothetical protein
LPWHISAQIMIHTHDTQLTAKAPKPYIIV